MKKEVMVRDNSFVALVNKSEFFRFVITGGLATALHYGLYYLLLRMSVNMTIAYTIGYLLSFIFNYLMSARFTFKRKTTKRNGVGFILAHLVNYFLQIFLLKLFVWLGVPEAFGPFPVYAISIPVNFLMVRFVFEHGTGKNR